MFVFICTNCGYGMAISSGVPIFCELCKKPTLRRGKHEEYRNCETNDGKLK